jgi:hypothetical protein
MPTIFNARAACFIGRIVGISAQNPGTTSLGDFPGCQ